MNPLDLRSLRERVGDCPFLKETYQRLYYANAKDHDRILIEALVMLAGERDRILETAIKLSEGQSISSFTITKETVR